MPVERRGLAAHDVFIKKGGRGEMTKTPITSAGPETKTIRQGEGRTVVAVLGLVCSRL